MSDLGQKFDDANRRIIEEAKSDVFAPWVFETLLELEREKGCDCEPQQEWYSREIPPDPTPRPSNLYMVDEDGNRVQLSLTSGGGMECGMRWKHEEDCPRYET